MKPNEQITRSLHEQIIGIEPQIQNAARQALIAANLTNFSDDQTQYFEQSIGDQKYSFTVTNNQRGGYNFQMQGGRRFSKSVPNIKLTQPHLNLRRKSNEAIFAQYIRYFLGLSDTITPETE